MGKSSKGVHAREKRKGSKKKKAASAVTRSHVPNPVASSRPAAVLTPNAVTAAPARTPAVIQTHSRNHDAAMPTARASCRPVTLSVRHVSGAVDSDNRMLDSDHDFTFARSNTRTQYDAGAPALSASPTEPIDDDVMLDYGDSADDHIGAHEDDIDVTQVPTRPEPVAAVREPVMTDAGKVSKLKSRAVARAERLEAAAPTARPHVSTSVVTHAPVQVLPVLPPINVTRGPVRVLAPPNIAVTGPTVTPPVHHVPRGTVPPPPNMSRAPVPRQLRPTDNVLALLAAANISPEQAVRALAQWTPAPVSYPSLCPPTVNAPPRSYHMAVAQGRPTPPDLLNRVVNTEATIDSLATAQADLGANVAEMRAAQELMGVTMAEDHSHLLSTLGKPSDDDQMWHALNKHVHKPDCFSGNTKTLSFREWVFQMENYMMATRIPVNARVPIAVSFLRGNAAIFWHARRQSLANEGKDPYVWAVFTASMLDRYASRAPELIARAKLQSLRQNSLSIQEYITQFDECYMHIPTFDESDKIFRFLDGLRANWKDKVSVNPTTAARWTSYNALTRFVVDHAAEFVTDTLTEYVHQAKGKRRFAATGNGSTPNGGGVTGSHRTTGSAGASAHKRRKFGEKPNTGPRKMVRMTDIDFTNPDPSQSVRVKNANQIPVTRSAPVFAYCRSHNMCAGCYKTTHQLVKECTLAPVAGTPPGFTA
jgi:hypothetical protein